MRAIIVYRGRQREQRRISQCPELDQALKKYSLDIFYASLNQTNLSEVENKV